MAGRASLTYLGEQDTLLTGNPQITYFNDKYTAKVASAKRYETIYQESPQQFGTESETVITQRGDFVSAMHLRIAFPNSDIGAAVVPSFGTWIIERAELYVGGVCVERLYGEFMELEWDLTIPLSKQGALTTLVGKKQTVLVNDLLVPLPFTLLGGGLVLSGPSVHVKLVLRPYVLPITPVFTYFVEYTYLTDGVTMPKIPQLFRQIQRMEFLVSGFASLPLTFGNLVKEILVVVQATDATRFDFSNVYLESMSLSFNGVERIAKQPVVLGTPTYLKIIQALEFHTRVPDYNVYMYSFALDPEASEPTGQVNMSAIQHQMLDINLVGTTTRKVHVYALTHNFYENFTTIFPSLF